MASPDPRVIIDRVAAFLKAAAELPPESQAAIIEASETLSQRIDDYKRAWSDTVALARAEIASLTRQVAIVARTHHRVPLDEYVLLQQRAMDLLMTDEVPWAELNDVLEIEFGEEGLERLKIDAAQALGGRRDALIRQATRARNLHGAGPIASYSRRLAERLRGAKGNTGS